MNKGVELDVVHLVTLSLAPQRRMQIHRRPYDSKLSQENILLLLSKMNINSSTSSTGMNPNDDMSAAAAMALAGLQSVPTSSSSSAEGGNNGGQQTGERSKVSGRYEEQAQDLEISKSFPQIVSRCI